jgi:hypothetical protein
VKQVTISGVRRLITTRADPAISIYLNRDTERGAAGRERLRELMRRASELLEAQLPRHRIDALLTPLAESARADRDAGKSVAFLGSPGMTAAYELPFEVPDLAVVASTFHTKPLVRVLDGAERFVLLAVGDGRATAYEGTRERLDLLELELPVQMPDESDEHWCRAVDECLREELWDRGDPVVLAGTQGRRAGFSKVSRYSYLLHDGVECDLGQVQFADLHRRAHEIVEDERHHVEGEAVARYLSAARESDATSDDLEVMCRAAVLRRVPLLLHRTGAHVWGTVHPKTGECRASAAEHPSAGNGDVIDDLCQLVLRAGGDVVELAPALMPTSSPVAAVVASPARVPSHRHEPSTKAAVA